MTQFAIQHASEIIDGPSYVIHANHLTDNYTAIISDFADRLSLITATPQVVTGALTFSAAATFTSGFTSNGGVTLASTFAIQGAATKALIASNIAKASVTTAGLYWSNDANPPGIRFNGTNTQFSNDGVAFSNIGSGAITAVVSRSSNTIWAATDNGTLFVCTSTFTQTITACATLATNWFCYIRNDGAGVITLDANAAETIDGALTIPIYPGEAFQIVCDGSNLKTVGRKRGWIPLLLGVGSGATQIDFTTFINGDFDAYKFFGRDFTVGATADILMRISNDAGSTWKSDANYDQTNYSAWQSSSGVRGGVSGTSFEVIRSVLSTANFSTHFETTLFNPSNTSLYKRMCTNISGGNTSSSGTGGEVEIGTCQYRGNTTAITGVRFLPSTSTFSGTIEMHGYRS